MITLLVLSSASATASPTVAAFAAADIASSNSESIASDKPFRVAIIGAGIGGAFTAEFLRNETNSALHIDVYEATARIGGRTLDTDEGASSVELGAAMAIVQNRYVVEAAGSLGLETELLSKGRGRGAGLLGITQDLNKSFVFQESKWPLVTLAKMARRYGLHSLFRLRKHGGDFIARFDQLYAAQDAQRTFDTPNELFAAAGLDMWPKQSCADAMAETVGRNRRISEELVAGLMHNNYGQAWRPSGALCCFTAIAPLAAGGSSAAFRVVGGNAAIARGLFARARARVNLQQRVSSISPQADGRYALNLTGSTDRRQSYAYDHIIVAMPCIPYESVPSGKANAGQAEQEAGAANLLQRCRPLPYQVLHTTLVWGMLNPTAFGSTLSVATFNHRFADILTTEHGNRQTQRSCNRVRANACARGHAHSPY